MEIVAKRLRDTLAGMGLSENDLPVWDGIPWPEDGTSWRVEPPPTMALVADQLGFDLGHLCRMLRRHYDSDERSPWAFVPGECGVLLVQVDSAGPPLS